MFEIRFDLLKPRIDKRVLEKQERQKADHDKNVRDRFFSKGEKVFAKNHGKGDKWLYGEIVEKSGPLSFHVKLDDGRVTRYHQDHLQKRSCSKPELPLQEEVSEPAVIPALPEVIPISNEVDSEDVTDTEPTHPPDEVPAVSTTQDIPTSATIPSGQATAAAPTLQFLLRLCQRVERPTQRGTGNNWIGLINNIDVSFFHLFFSPSLRGKELCSDVLKSYYFLMNSLSHICGSYLSVIDLEFCNSLVSCAYCV